MDLDGFIVVWSTDWDAIKESVKKYFDAKRGNWEWGIGTNESVEFNSFEAWERSFTTISLTQEDAATFISTCQRIGMRPGEGLEPDDKRIIIQFGFFPLPDRFSYEYDLKNADEDDDLLSFLNLPR